ncbi:MFS transporter [Kitasatospora saccharophila]|uniref:MFS transporter n=1 Tax=Kitasatospora saccharophila TaxID=407973 RepID=UPI0036400631
MLSRLPGRYGLLWTASLVSCVGDGVLLTAGPLLVLSLNDNPTVVAGAQVAVTLPYLLLGLVGGVAVDRFDRRRLMAGLDFVRSALLALVVFSLLVGVARIPLLLVTLFLLAAADTVFRTAVQTTLPLLVPAERLVRANGRLMAAETLGLEFIGPALGGLLFAAAVSLPFVVDGVSFAASGLLVLLALAGPRATWAADGPGAAAAADAAAADAAAKSAPRAPRPGIRGVLREAGEGLRWMWREATLRFLATSSATINFFTGATNAVIVLYAHDVLHLGKAGFGLLLSCAAAGGVLAGFVSGKIADRLGVRGCLTLAVGLQAVDQTVLLLAHDRVLTALALTCSSFAVVQFSSVSLALRQSTIPKELLGRVTSVYRMLAWGSLPVGAMTAGLFVGWFGLRSTFALGAVALAVLAVLVLTRAAALGLEMPVPAAPAAPPAVPVTVPTTAPPADPQTEEAAATGPARTDRRQETS